MKKPDITCARKMAEEILKPKVGLVMDKSNNDAQVEECMRTVCPCHSKNR